ncbi:hypothetical protein PGB90_003681 [Kerria lacca]
MNNNTEESNIEIKALHYESGEWYYIIKNKIMNEEYKESWRTAHTKYTELLLTWYEKECLKWEKEIPKETKENSKL